MNFLGPSPSTTLMGLVSIAMNSTMASVISLLRFSVVGFWNCRVCCVVLGVVEDVDGCDAWGCTYSMDNL